MQSNGASNLLFSGLMLPLPEQLNAVAAAFYPFPSYFCGGHNHTEVVCTVCECGTIMFHTLAGEHPKLVRTVDHHRHRGSPSSPAHDSSAVVKCASMERFECAISPWHGSVSREPAAEQKGSATSPFQTSLLPLATAQGNGSDGGLEQQTADSSVATSQSVFRCVLGFSNGRVEVYDGASYCYGFSAYPSHSVLSARVLLSGECANTLDEVVVTLSSGGEITLWTRAPWSAAPPHDLGAPQFHKTSLHEGSWFSTPPKMAVANQTVVLFTGGGFSKNLYCSTSSGEKAEASLGLPGSMQKTTALAADGPVCVAARSKVIYTVNYLTYMAKKLVEMSNDVVALVLNYPMAIAVLSDCTMVCFGVDTGRLFGKCVSYSTSRPPRNVSLCSDRMILLYADASGACELVKLPAIFRRYCTKDHATLHQANVIQRLIALEEDSSRARLAYNEEMCLLARYLVPDEVGDYLPANFVVP